MNNNDNAYDTQGNCVCVWWLEKSFLLGLEYFSMFIRGEIVY